MSRIRDYSTNQLHRVHENYIFQRQRLRKYNAQNYLKMRETRQYTRRTLQKVMENLPALYMDLTTCRQGLGDRQPSIIWDPNIDPAQVWIFKKNILTGDLHITGYLNFEVIMLCYIYNISKVNRIGNCWISLSFVAIQS